MKPQGPLSALLLCAFLIVATLGSLLYTQDLQQKNSEKIFLTEDSIESYEKFEEDYSQKSLIIIQTDKIDQSEEAVKELFLKECPQECEAIGPSDIPPTSHPLFRLESQDKIIQILLAPMSAQEQMKKAIEKLKKTFPKANFAGTSYTNYLLDEYSESIKSTIFPALFLSVFILLLFTLKSFKEALITFFAPLMASALSLLATKVFFGSSTLVTSIVPLLLFIINLSLILHIHHTAKEFGSMIHALHTKKAPIFLMAFTTFIGFGSLYFSKLEAISHFGILSALLFILTTIFCVLWPWSLSKVYPTLWSKDPQNDSIAPSSLMIKITSAWSLTKVALFSAFLCLAGILTYSKIPIITDATEYFPAKEKVKTTMQEMAKNLLGTPILEIIIEKKKEDFNLEDLKKIFHIEEIIASDQALQIISANQLAVMANEIYTQERVMPPNILSYYTLLSKAPGDLALGYGHDEGHRITILGGPTNIEEYEVFLAQIEKLLTDNQLSFHFNGLYYHLMVAQKEMIVTLFKSFTISLILISLCALIFFKQIKLFFIFLMVNIIPVLGSFPILYLIGNSFNVATVMTYSISLGLIVDSSFHIIHSIHEKKQREKYYFYRTIIVPIVQGSMLLTLCFSFFCLSGFLPIKEFGLSLSTVIFLGMILDLKVLPALYKN